MRKLSVFNFLTLNGFYKGPGDDISWHQHNQDANDFAEQGANSDSLLLFGRVTYEMMASFWPTPAAREMMPAIAEGMNRSEKIVFSKTLKKADWNSTTIVSDNIVEAVQRIKSTAGKDMTILGSGSIVTLFTEHKLIDHYQLMIDPLALGAGTPLFSGLKKTTTLKLTNTRTFRNGSVLLEYSGR